MNRNPGSACGEISCIFVCINGVQPGFAITKMSSLACLFSGNFEVVKKKKDYLKNSKLWVENTDFFLQIRDFFFNLFSEKT